MLDCIYISQWIVHITRYYYVWIEYRPTLARYIQGIVINYFFIGCKLFTTCREDNINIMEGETEPIYTHSLQSQVNTGRWPNAGLMSVQRRSRWTNINPALGQRPVLAGNDNIFLLCFCGTVQASTNHCPNAVSMLGHRLRRWPNIKTTLGQNRLVCHAVPRPDRYIVLIFSGSQIDASCTPWVNN